MYRIIILFVAILVLLSLVACGNPDADVSHFFEQDQVTDNRDASIPDDDELIDEQNVSDETDELAHEPIDELVGNLTIFIARGMDSEMAVYRRMFQELHPQVDITFEFYDFPLDTASHLALVTRLLADPPDIFYFMPRMLNFEKMSLEALFVNLYDMFDGPRGISMDDYFSNIFAASEMQGGLFSVPLHLELMLAYPNIRLFEGAGLDVAEISSVSVDDELNLFDQIALAFPDETIHPNMRSSIWRSLTHYPLYNVETGEVNANTPEMAERIRRSMDIPIMRMDGSYVVVFTPEFVAESIVGITTISAEFINHNSNLSRLIFHSHMDSSTGSLSVFFLQSHPNIQFAEPIQFNFGNRENIAFSSNNSLSIMRNSSDVDLAWEFIRFIMEYEESLHHIPTYHASWSLPINRNRFANQVYIVLQELFDHALMFTDVEQYIQLPLDDYREQQIERALTHTNNIMEQLNFEVTQNFAVLKSLVYPDIWLVYTGQQTVEQALENIQSRLELYVEE